MKQVVLAICLAFPVPVLAQDAGEIEEGFSLLEQGAKLLFRGIISEMEPVIEDFSGMASELEPALELFATEMGSALIELMQTLDSMRYYEAPEVLPNGDIIIRRSPDAPEFDPNNEMEPIDL